MQHDSCIAFARPDWHIWSYALSSRTSWILTYVVRDKDLPIAVAIYAMLRYIKAATFGLEALCPVD